MKMKSWRKPALFVLGVVALISGPFALGGCGSTSIGVDVPMQDTVWILDKYFQDNQSHTVLWSTRITAYFSQSEQIVRGSGGCNTYQGDYRVSGDTSLSVENVISTLIGCSASIATQEQAYLDLLGKAKSYTVVGSTLTIDCSNGQLIFRP